MKHITIAFRIYFVVVINIYPPCSKYSAYRQLCAFVHVWASLPTVRFRPTESNCGVDPLTPYYHSSEILQQNLGLLNTPGFKFRGNQTGQLYHDLGEVMGEMAATIGSIFSQTAFHMVWSQKTNIYLDKVPELIKSSHKSI